MHFQLATLALFVLSGITNALPNPGETPTGYGGTTTSTWGTKSTCTPSTGYSYSTGYSTYSTVSVTTIPSTSYSTVCIHLPPSLPCLLPIPTPSLSPLHSNHSPPPHRQPPPQSKLSPKPTSSPPPPTKPSTPPLQASPSLQPPTRPKLSRQKSLVERPRCPEKMLSTP